MPRRLNTQHVNQREHVHRLRHPQHGVDARQNQIAGAGASAFDGEAPQYLGYGRQEAYDVRDLGRDEALAGPGSQQRNISTSHQARRSILSPPSMGSPATRDHLAIGFINKQSSKTRQVSKTRSNPYDEYRAPQNAVAAPTLNQQPAGQDPTSEEAA